MKFLVNDDAHRKKVADVASTSQQPLHAKQTTLIMQSVCGIILSVHAMWNENLFMRQLSVGNL